MAEVVKLKYYSDAGHGWVAVKNKIIESLNIADKITPYSFMKGGTVYLEEDCDLSTLVEALKANNVLYSMTAKPPSRGPHPIRYYQRYIPS